MDIAPIVGFNGGLSAGVVFQSIIFRNHSEFYDFWGMILQRRLKFKCWIFRNIYARSQARSGRW